MSAQGTFVCVFDRMDGRCQGPVNDWARKEFGADYADTITIAGLDGVLPKDKTEQERSLGMAKISAEKHGAKCAVVVGHSGCAGFPVEADEHRRAIKESCELIRSWGLFDRIAGLFVDVDAKTIGEVCRA